MHTLALLLLLTLAVPAATDASWLHHPRWDDGWAEVARYEGRLRTYGKLRDASMEIITVREHFHPERMVKTRPEEGREAIPVMKQILQRRFRTGVYEYVQMSTGWLHRDSGRPVKLTTVSMEWCGSSTTTATWPSVDAPGRLRIQDYMDDMGEAEHGIPPGMLPYDLLIPWLRQHLGRVHAGDTRPGIASLLTNHPVLRESAIRIEAVDRAEAEEVPSWRIRIRHGERAETFWLRDDPLRTLLRWENDQGEFFRLRDDRFLDYWNRNRPGDERLLDRPAADEGGRPPPSDHESG